MCKQFRLNSPAGGKLHWETCVRGLKGGLLVGAQGQSEGQLCAQHSQQTQLSRTIYNFAQFSCRGMPIKTWSLIRSYVTASFISALLHNFFRSFCLCLNKFFFVHAISWKGAKMRLCKSKRKQWKYLRITGENINAMKVFSH